MNVTAKDLLDHLDTNCGSLHPSKLVNLPIEMMGYYIEVDGIPKYINMLEEAQCKLAHANLPLSNDRLLAIAFMTVLATEHFSCPTDEWEALPCTNKTWMAWKVHYCVAHIACKWQMLSTRKTTDGGTANLVITAEDATISPETFTRLDGYLDNLPAAVTTECTTLASLCY